jgi:hypothetical protein
LERAASTWELLAESWLTAKDATRKRLDARRALSS